MAINKKLIHFREKQDFNSAIATDSILDTSIVFIQDSQEIYTHGEAYKAVNWSVLSDSSDPSNPDQPSDGRFTYAIEIPMTYARLDDQSTGSITGDFSEQHTALMNIIETYGEVDIYGGKGITDRTVVEQYTNITVNGYKVIELTTSPYEDETISMTVTNASETRTSWADFRNNHIYF